ncbi:MAG: hypothetical protein ACKO26_05355 [Planctomycetota bacterium]
MREKRGSGWRAWPCRCRDERCHPRGGAIALGHPLGATGARLLVSLSRSIGRGDCRRGVVALCVGGGQGVAAVLESA